MPSFLLLYGLTILTGAIHLGIGVATMGESLSTILILNGIGYFGLLGGHILAEWRGYGSKLHHITLLAYTVVTIIAYFVTFGADGLTNVVGMATKVIELVMCGLLVKYLRPKQ